jgi:hypothetical protein
MNYPRIPELDSRAAGESIEQYGLRALLFVLANEVTCTVDTEGLELANYVFPLAVSGRDLSPVAAERLAVTQTRITGELRRRQAARQAVVDELQAPRAAGVDKPNLGPGAPLRPAPVVPPSPSAQAPAPVPVTGPAAIPARQTAISPALAARQTFQPVIRPVARPSVPAAPQVPADQWGF